MISLNRRSLLRASLAVAAGASLARPYIANAAATTATAWWAQGFAQEEDISLRKIVADYEKASGNTIDLSIVPFAPLRQKIISAITSGSVPDLIDANPLEIVPEEAWNGRLVDVSDVVETQKSHYLPTALISAHCYDNEKKERGVYGVPYKGSVRPFHYWRDLVDKAGYKESETPENVGRLYRFFQTGAAKAARSGDAARLRDRVCAQHQSAMTLRRPLTNF